MTHMMTLSAKIKMLLLPVVVAVCYMPECQAGGIRVGMVHWIAYSPLNVAAKKGFWAEQGLQVEVANYKNNQLLNDAFRADEVDIALDMLGSWIGLYTEGLPIRILGETDWSHGGDKVIVKHGFSLDQLKGKSIGIYLRQPSVMFFLGKFLQSRGLSYSDVYVVAVPTIQLTDNFIKNRFSIIINYDPNAIRAEREGGGQVIASSAGWEGVIPEGFVTKKQTLISLSKDDLKKFFIGWIKAIEWIQDTNNFIEYIDILNNMTFASDETIYTEEDIRKMLSSVRIHSTTTLLRRNLSGVSDYINQVRSFLAANNLAKRDFTVDAVLDNSTLIEVLQQTKTH